MHEIVEFKDINKFISDLKVRQDVRIAFTNGCFDVIHRGHVQYLEKAKETAHLLVVGLNSDDSVRRLKGNDRPYIQQEDRAYVLSRLEAVDIVCIFDQDTPMELLRLVRPDILAKGADYTLEQIVGREFIESYGGKVITIPLVQGRSTTGILGRIRKDEQ